MPSTITAIDIQLDQINNITLEARSNLFEFAKQYARESGSKIIRSKERQSSKILGPDGKDITPQGIEMPLFPQSVINYNGKHYLLLVGNIFYNPGEEADNPAFNPVDSFRGLRKGKLAIDEDGEIFFVKIIEHRKGYFHQNHLIESNRELFFFRMVEEMIPLDSEIESYQEAVTREKIDTNTVKIYSVTPLQKRDSYAMLKEGRLGLSQTMDLALQYMQLVFFLEQKNILHRDIKPPNIVLSVQEDWQLSVGLIDFGSAVKTLLGEDPWYNHTRAGTTEFLCPRMQKIVKKNQQLYDEYCEEYKRHQNLTPNSTLPPFKPLPYIYNFATEMYAAAESARYILRHWQPYIDSYVYYAQISPEEGNLFKRIYNMIESILSLEIFQKDSESPLEIAEIYLEDEYIDMTLDTLKEYLEELRVNTRELIAKARNFFQERYQSPQTTQETYSRNTSREQEISESLPSPGNNSASLFAQKTSIDSSSDTLLSSPKNSWR